MTKYILDATGTIVNIIAIAPDVTIELQDGHTLVEIPEAHNAELGGTYTNEVYTPPVISTVLEDTQALLVAHSATLDDVCTFLVAYLNLE